MVSIWRTYSNSRVELFQMHFSRLRLGDRAFAVTGPPRLHSLPTHVRLLDLSLDTFRRKLKTYLTVRGISA